MSKQLNFKKVLGTHIIVQREKFPEKTSHGIIIPTTISNDTVEVGSFVKLNPYQNRGTIVGLGDKLETTLQVGDVVVFNPSAATPIATNPSDPSEIVSLINREITSEYVVLDSYGIYYAE